MLLSALIVWFEQMVRAFRLLFNEGLGMLRFLRGEF